MDWIKLVQGRAQLRSLVDTAIRQHSGSSKGGEFLDHFGNYQLLKKDSAEGSSLLVCAIALLMFVFIF
jgi:hypothetical protein